MTCHLPFSLICLFVNHIISTFCAPATRQCLDCTYTYYIPTEKEERRRRLKNAYIAILTCVRCKNKKKTRKLTDNMHVNLYTLYIGAVWKTCKNQASRNLPNNELFLSLYPIIQFWADKKKCDPH